MYISIRAYACVCIIHISVSYSFDQTWCVLFLTTHHSLQLCRDATGAIWRRVTTLSPLTVDTATAPPSVPTLGTASAALALLPPPLPCNYSFTIECLNNRLQIPKYRVLMRPVQLSSSVAGYFGSWWLRLALGFLPTPSTLC